MNGYDNTQGQSGQGPNQQQGGTDGFTMAQQQGLATKFLEPGGTFEEMILNSSFSYADLMDWCTIYRKGLKARVPEMVNHAYHALSASAADGGEAKMFALSTITGMRGMQTSTPTKRTGWWSKMRGKTSTDPMAPQMPGPGE